MLLMAVALFLTASRGGFVTLVVAGVVCLWHFGVRGRRLYLIFAAALAMAVLLAVAGDRLKDRFFAISGQDLHGGMENSAYGSYEERQELMRIAVHGVMRYPILGIGMHNFPNYSGKWRDVHVAYLQIAVEGGIPILILYLLFFWRSFANLRFLGKIRDLDRDTKLLVAALHSSLVGFVVGACFSPEAYQYFPYFTVAYTSVLVAIVRERQRANLDRQNSLKLQSDSYASDPRTNTLTFSH
jgi:O-antigen ligase